MPDRLVSGLLAPLVVATAVAIGLYAFVTNYALGSPGDLLAPTLASLAVAALFVFGLFVLGARSDRWLRNPYW